MDQQATPALQAYKLSLPRWEFITLAAALMALNALAIDIMLPGLQQIGASLGVENENHRQYVITAYIAGVGDNVAANVSISIIVQMLSAPAWMKISRARSTSPDLGVCTATST